MCTYLPLHEIGETAHGERRAVGLAHEEPLEDDGIELALGPPHQETVELHPTSNATIRTQKHNTHRSSLVYPIKLLYTTTNGEQRTPSFATTWKYIF